MAMRASVLLGLGTFSLGVALTIITENSTATIGDDLTMTRFYVFLVVAVAFIIAGMWLGWLEDKKRDEQYTELKETISALSNTLPSKEDIKNFTTAIDKITEMMDKLN